MKLLTLLSAVLLLSFANAFAPTVSRANPKALVVLRSSENDDDADAATLSRREAMRKGATAALVSMSVASALTPEVALADIYDEQEKERKRKQKEDAENARKLVPAVLFGGTALSVPFFFPNLVRLGKKFVSLGKDDGYGGPK